MSGPAVVPQGAPLPVGVDSVRMPCGFRVIFDEADADVVGARRWHGKRKNSDWARVYAQSTLHLEPGRGGKKKNVALHRLLVGAVLGDGLVVDHRNGDTLDNRRSNLRVTDVRGNATNITRSKNQRLGGFKGVSWNKNAGKWSASISSGPVKLSGKRARVHLGLFTDPAVAARAYDAAAREHFGAYAALNFPDAANDTALVGKVVSG